MNRSHKHKIIPHPYFSFILLAFLLIMGTSCKKDRKTWYTSTFKGVAVDYFDGTPIAGLRVALVKKYKIREMYPDIPVYEFDTLEVTTSDQSGEFKFKCRTQQNEFYADDNAGNKYYTPVEYYVVFTGNDTYFAQSYKINNPGKWHQKKEIVVRPYINLAFYVHTSTHQNDSVVCGINTFIYPGQDLYFVGAKGYNLDTVLSQHVPFIDSLRILAIVSKDYQGQHIELFSLNMNCVVNKTSYEYEMVY